MRDPSSTLGSPAWSTNASKRSPITCGYENQRGFHPGEVEGAGNSDILLKSQLTDFLSQALTPGSGGGTMPVEVPETYRERMNCVATG